MIVLVIQTVILQHQNQRIDLQNSLIKHQGNRLDQQTYLQEADRRGSLVFLFSNIMDQIDKEILASTNRELSPQLTGRIIALSSRLKPYKYLEGDSLIKSPLSPERGQLLISLLESKLANSTYRKIFARGDFSYADLKGAVLDSFNIEGVNLMYSDFTNANLEATNLSNANLMRTNFKNCYMNSANLSNSNLNYSIMTANLNNSTLVNSYFTNMEKLECSFKGAKIESSSFENSNIKGSDFSSATINNTYFRLINLDSVFIDDIDWFKTLSNLNEIESLDSLNNFYKIEKRIDSDFDIWRGNYIIRIRNIEHSNK